MQTSIDKSAREQARSAFTGERADAEDSDANLLEHSHCGLNILIREEQVAHRLLTYDGRSVQEVRARLETLR